MKNFDKYIGIDWSGAKSDPQKDLSVCVAEAGKDCPYKQPPPHGGKNWSRYDLYEWLLQESQEKSILVGIDFSFAYPIMDDFCNECGYFPEYPESPEKVHELWALIDEKNADQENFYGGGIYNHPDLGRYYKFERWKERDRYSSRMRMTEKVARLAIRTRSSSTCVRGTNEWVELFSMPEPSPTFACHGPANVGTGSLAGMRLLHHLSDKAHIWPFDVGSTENHNLWVVEIFPSYYFALAEVKAKKIERKLKDNLNKALNFFDSTEITHDLATDHDADALISAAALRHFASTPAYWHIPKIASHIAPDIVRREGWIFGVRYDKS